MGRQSTKLPLLIHPSIYEWVSSFLREEPSGSSHLLQVLPLNIIIISLGIKFPMHETWRIHSNFGQVFQVTNSSIFMLDIIQISLRLLCRFLRQWKTKAYDFHREETWLFVNVSPRSLPLEGSGKEVPLAKPLWGLIVI
jgi:hypothetical protein